MASTDISGIPYPGHDDLPVLLASAYLPNLDYFRHLLSGKIVWLEKYENYTKQSFRNRCMIYSANGPLALSVPVVHHGDKTLISETRISYSEAWQNRHWRAITSAYKNSPYFDYFESELRVFYDRPYEFLFDYNLQLIQAILKLFRQVCVIQVTGTYIKKPGNMLDLRESIHPKSSSLYSYPEYYQVFAGKHGFISNLSIIDLLFHEGMNALLYLQQAV